MSPSPQRSRGTPLLSRAVPEDVRRSWVNSVESTQYDKARKSRWRRGETSGDNGVSFRLELWRSGCEDLKGGREGRVYLSALRDGCQEGDRGLRQIALLLVLLLGVLL